jgi:hypothetical protein
LSYFVPSLYLFRRSPVDPRYVPPSGMGFRF